MLAQSARYVISGIVKDGLTGETLPSANVFLSGTTFGNTTDQNGEFQLKVFERGSYELVVRFVGYETYYQAIEFTVPEDKGFEVILMPESVNLGSVVVTDKRDEEWKRNLETFKRAFLGISKNASRCKILNEDEINFFYNTSNRTLEAFIEGPIRIENRALGYDLNYYLENFIIDYKQGLTQYYGFTQFSDAKEGNGEKKRFQKARKLAYKGSREHFFNALYHDRLKAEGFEVSLAEDVEGFGRALIKLDADLYDSLKNGPSDISRRLGFENYVYITYLNEIESAEYAGTNSMRLKGEKTPKLPQRSWIKLMDTKEPIIFEQNGYVVNPISFFSNGYWGFEKVAEMIPTNYQPEDN